MAALFHHLETERSLRFFHGSVNIKYENCEGTVLIDANTAKNLELVCNNLMQDSVTSSSNNKTLLSVLNRTLTPMGARLLRTNVLQPPSDLQTIEMRLDAVQDLIEDESLLADIRRAIKDLPDIDQLISFVRIMIYLITLYNIYHADYSESSEFTRQVH